MSRSPRRLLAPAPANLIAPSPPSTPSPAAGRTQVQQIELDQFSRRLHALMTERGMSQSDLAAAIWGRTTDTRGYSVARNRDRISAYLRGDSLPEPQNLNRLAEALGVETDQLAPDLTAATVDREKPEMAMTMVAGHSDKVHLTLNTLLPLSVAAQIITLVEQAKQHPHRTQSKIIATRDGE